jgi:hypothetical protein
MPGHNAWAGKAKTCLWADLAEAVECVAWADNARAAEAPECVAGADPAEVFGVAEDIRDRDNADFAKEILNGSRIMN